MANGYVRLVKRDDTYSMYRQVYPFGFICGEVAARAMGVKFEDAPPTVTLFVTNQRPNDSVYIELRINESRWVAWREWEPLNRRWRSKYHHVYSQFPSFLYRTLNAVPGVTYFAWVMVPE